MWRLLIPALAAALASPPAAAPAYPTPQATRAEFLALCRAARGGDDFYHGEAIVADLRRRLAAPVASPEVQVGIRGRLGSELLRLDEPEEAAGLLEEALTIATAHHLSPALVLQVKRHLALALTQWAEEENCVHNHRATSCILPIDPEAVHTLAAHTRRAGDLYLDLARQRPGDVQMRWLLNFSRMVSGDYPQGVPPPLRLPADALAPDAPFPRWTDIAAPLGVASLDLSGGGAMDDFDGDGLLDLLSSTWDPCGPMKAFRNDGRGGFEEVSQAWGLDAQAGGLNLFTTDFDNDGHLDVLVLRGAWRGEHGEVRNSLLRNDLHGPTGRFVDVTAAAGITGAYPTQAASWGDYDGDGDLDVYIGNEAVPERPYPSQLFRNEGDGTFVEVAAQAGVVNGRFAKSVAWGDYDEDGDPDLYVSNIGPNRLYRNEGDGTFTDVAAELGVAEPEVSFASWFFDFDNDGDLDLFVVDYGSHFSTVSAAYLGLPTEGGHPRLYRNDGDGTFTDVSATVGLWRPLLPMGANYGDLDNDGWLDVYLGTGVPDLEAVMPNVLYRNAEGERFDDITTAAGLGHVQKGHGIAFGDLDNDGDQDLFEQMGGAYPVDAFYNALYENPGNGNAWVTLRLEGRRANRFGVGARIEVAVRGAEGRRSIYLRAGSGGSFGSSSMQQEVGLGRAEAIEAITIRWPGSGTVQVFRNVALRRAYRAVEGEPELLPLELPTFTLQREGGMAHPHRPTTLDQPPTAAQPDAAEPDAAEPGAAEPGAAEAGAAEAPAAAPQPGAAQTAAPGVEAMGRAVELIRQGDAEGALRQARRAAAEAPGAVEPRLLEISLLVSLRRLDEAQGALESTAAAFPGVPDVAYHQGLVAMLQGRAPAAEEAFRRALQLDPRHVKAMSNLAALLLGQGRAEEAEALLRRVLAVDPGNAAAREQLRRLTGAPPGGGL